MTLLDRVLKYYMIAGTAVFCTTVLLFLAGILFFN